MGQKYLTDTNVVIDYFAQLLPINAINLIHTQPSQLSVVTRIELLSWQNLTPTETVFFTDFIQSCIVFELDETVVVKTIEVRKKYKLKLGDAVIAATALLYNLTLLSRNVSDFKRVPELKIINPHEL